MVKNLIAFFFIDRQKTLEIRASRLEYPRNILSPRLAYVMAQKVVAF